MKPKICVFMGTRPEAIKLAPVIKALQEAPDLEPVVVSTGQHREMLAQVVDLFDIPVHHELDVMRPNQGLASLTARLLSGIDRVLEAENPAFAFAQGDTTTVLSTGLACFYRQIPMGHIEAGLRTRNLLAPFPEEANRCLVSVITRLHFAPTQISFDNLVHEHVSPERITITGNTVIDALRLEIAKQREPWIAREIHETLSHAVAPDWESRPFVLVTGHRRENFGAGLEQICDALKTLARRFPAYRFVYPVHLNPNVQRPVRERLHDEANICLIPPQDYRTFVALMNASRLILTDSGGVQEEAPSLGRPVLVMRDTTERPEGVAAGTVRLVGADTDTIVSAVSELLTDADVYRAMAEAVNPYGDGHAAQRVVSRLRAELSRESASPGDGSDAIEPERVSVASALT